MIEIRDAISRDSAHLALVGIRSWESAVTGWGANTAELRINAHAAYRDFCVNHWDKIMLAHNGGTIVGWGAREKLDEFITDLWVDPDHQGEGAGKLLLAALEQDMLAAGYKHAELETHVKNTPAIGFYEYSGYRVVSLSVKYSESLQQDIQIVSMRKAPLEPIEP
jgi:ribosomal-protein-alanine N-acetyltransferase